MVNPTLLMMDEPSLGLAPMLVQEIFISLSKSTVKARRCC